MTAQGKINLHSLIRCNPLGAILTPLKLLKVRALTHACFNVLHIYFLTAEPPSTCVPHEAPKALICRSKGVEDFIHLQVLTAPAKAPTEMRIKPHKHADRDAGSYS